MKDKSKKHDHKGTKILKLGIFTSVMLAPLFAIGFKCAYATFNKNAYQSYSVENSDNFKLVNNQEKILENNLYQFTTNNDLLNLPTQDYILGTNIKVINGSANIPTNAYRFRLYYNGNNQSYSIQIDGDTTLYTTIGNSSSIGIVTLSFLATQTQNTNNYINNIYLYEFGTSQTLDNAFYYAINQMKDNELFSWTKNTALYTPINAMTSGLGITTDAIAVLLAYWLYITLIYVVFDIVIELFTYLSHLIMGNPMG